MYLLNKIHGKGGGGGKSGGGGSTRVAVEDPNTLQSNSIARFTDVLSEGEIEGLVAGAQSIYFDSTALEASNGEENFDGVSYVLRHGTADQSYVPGFANIESEITVGVEVTHDNPVVRTIQEIDIDYLRLTIRIPALYQQDTSNGDMHGSSVQLRVYARPTDGDYEEIATNYAWESFSGTTSQSSVAGLKFISSITSTGGMRNFSYSLTAKYRKVGDTAWTILQSSTFDVVNNYEQSYAYQLVQSDDPDGRSYYASVPTGSYYWAPTTFSNTFEVTGLSPGQYEIAVDGASSISSSYGYVGQPITISGKCTSTYETQYAVDLPGDGPWDVKVVRETADSESSALQNQTYWSAYTKVIDHKLSYPHTAYIAIEVNAEDFGSSVPERKYLIKGIKCAIPDNYDPIARTYTGIWDGVTFNVAWTDNPAWVIYDLLINNRYGLGEYISTDDVDVTSLYAIAQYCDELVDDGYGGTEPRFTFNGTINSRDDAYKVIQSVASAFRGMAYWATGSIFFYQDRPADIKRIITNSSVVDGDFVYSGTAIKARHTSAQVRWADPDLNYADARELVEDAELIEKYGWNQKEITASGCTSRGQARRYGKWILDTERYETETATFQMSFEHVDLVPGDVIGIIDRWYIGGELCGRVVEATITSVTLDRAVTLEDNLEYTLYLRLPDGSMSTATVTNEAGEHTVITTESALAEAPLPFSEWGLGSANADPRTFRVLSIAEKETNVFEITALYHDPDKFSRVERDIYLEPATYARLPSGAISPPSDITVTEYLYAAGPSVKSAATIGWTASEDSRASFTQVQVKRPGEYVWEDIETTSTQSCVLYDTTDGIHEIRMRALSTSGQYSSWLISSNVLLGLKAAPANVSGFKINIIDSTAYLSWDGVTDLDISHYKIKYSSAISGATWGSSILLVEKVSHPTTSVTVPALIGSYLIKSVDYSGVECDTASVVISNILSIAGSNVIDVITDTQFSGDRNNIDIHDGGGIRLSYADDVLSRTNWFSGDWFLGTSGLSSSGIYYCSERIDLSEVYTSRLTASISVSGLNLAEDFFSVINVFSLTDWFGADPSSWSVRLQVRTTNHDPGIDDDWSDWSDVIVGDYTTRAFEFRCILSSSEFGVTPVITAINVQIDMPDRVIGDNDISCHAGGVRVNFSPAFKELRALVFNDQGLNIGDRGINVERDAAGFTRKYVDSNGNDVARSFDYVATGYGRVSV